MHIMASFIIGLDDRISLCCLGSYGGLLNPGFKLRKEVFQGSRCSVSVLFFSGVMFGYLCDCPLDGLLSGELQHQ